MISSLNNLYRLNNYVTAAYSMINRSFFGYDNATKSIMSRTAADSIKFAKQNVANMKGLKKAASALSGAASSLGAKTLSSSNTDVATASAKFYSQAKGASFDVNISAVAKEQISESDEVNASAKNQMFSVGYNSMQVVSQGKTTTLRFYVGEGDTNGEVLSSIAKSMNKANLGIAANVSSSNGKSRLTFRASATGLANGFNVSFIKGQMNIRNVQEAQNAEYSLNGKSYTSESNIVPLPYGEGSITLQSTGDAKVTRALETDSLVNAADDFVDAYNNAVSWLDSNTEGGAGVNKALHMISNIGLSKLSAIGISMGKDGKLSLHGDKLAKAAQNSPSTVRNMLRVSERVGSGAGSAMRIPSASYTDFRSMSVSNSLIDMLMPSTGSLFDFKI